MLKVVALHGCGILLKIPYQFYFDSFELKIVAITAENEINIGTNNFASTVAII